MESVKGVSLRAGDYSPPKSCIEKTDIKGDEVCIGFYGGFGKSLDEFGFVCMKKPIIRRVDIHPLKSGREYPF